MGLAGEFQGIHGEFRIDPPGGELLSRFGVLPVEKISRPYGIWIAHQDPGVDHHLGGRVDDPGRGSSEHDGTRTEATASLRDIGRDPPTAELLCDSVARL